MSKDQFKVYHLALKVLEGDLKLKDFAILIGLSKRQAIRKVQRIKEMDYLGAIHGNSGNVPFNKKSDEFEGQIMHLLKTKYQGFNLTHFREMLLVEEKIDVKKTTLQSWAKNMGFKSTPEDPLRSFTSLVQECLKKGCSFNTMEACTVGLEVLRRIYF